MSNPQQMRPCVVNVTADDSVRVRMLIQRLGSIRAAKMALGISDQTFAAARDEGRMLRATYEKLLSALARAERAA